MKKMLLSLLLLILIVLSAAAYFVKNPVFQVKKAPKENCYPPSETLLQEHVKTLTGISPPRSVKYPEGLEKASEYIYNTFKSFGMDPKEQKFMVDNREYKNIVTLYGAPDKPRVVIGAHYDVYDDQPGADDNASGVAGLLEIGRMLDSIKPDLPYAIELVAYTNEEPPFFRTPYMGSAVHARSLKEEGVEVKCMISLEMIGYFSDKKGSQEFPIAALKALYPATGNFIAVVGKMENQSLVRKFKKAMNKCGSISVESINAPATIPGIDFSDHQNYWAAGFPALMITDTSFYRNPHYHKKTDTFETLDFSRMAGVVEAVFYSITNWPS